LTATGPEVAGAHAAATSGERRSWQMLAGVWAVYFAFGALIGATAALVPAIRDDLGLTRGEMGLALGTWQLVYLAAAVPAGKVIDRAGLRVSLFIAASVIAISAIVRSVAWNLPTLLIGVAIFGVGGPLISVGAPKLVAQRFTDLSRRRAVGVYGTGPAFGSAAALAGTNSVLLPLVGDSWRAAMLVVAAISFAAGGLWVLAFRDGRAADPGEVEARLPYRRLLEFPIVRVILFLAIGSFFYGHALSNWLVDMLETSGWTTQQAGYWASVPTLLGVVATLILPQFATEGRRAPLLTAMLAMAGVSVLFITASSASVLAPALVASGTARSMIMPICMLVLMDDPRIGARNMAAAGGLFFTAGEVGGVLGPIVTGFLADSTGGFATSIWTLAAVMMILAAMTMTRLSTALGSPLHDANPNTVDPAQ